MESTEAKIGRLADRVSSEMLQQYTNLLRQNLVDAGVDPTLFDDMAQTSLLELQVQQSQASILEQALRSEEARGVDSIGRIVTEFCFVRTSAGTMLWPEYSDKDTLARWQFEESVLPRPLLRYFLVSVRGTVEPIDAFEAPPFLFDEPETLDELKSDITLLLDEFKGPFGTGEAAVDWPEVYEDPRFREIARDLVVRMSARLADHGLESYLQTLERYREQDPRRNDANLMQRAITIEDARQIQTALARAEQTLRPD